MKNNTASNGRGVESFLARHGQNVIGVLSGFDRLRLQGTLRSLYRPDGMARFLERVGEPWKNFKAYVCELTGCIRSKAEDWAKGTWMPKSVSTEFLGAQRRGGTRNHLT